MTLYVARLDRAVHNSDLMELFSEYGEVESAFIVKDKALGVSKGFGFVTMADEISGKKAILELDGKLFAGKEIVVKEAEDRRK